MIKAGANPRAWIRPQSGSVLPSSLSPLLPSFPCARAYSRPVRPYRRGCFARPLPFCGTTRTRTLPPESRGIVGGGPGWLGGVWRPALGQRAGAGVPVGVLYVRSACCLGSLRQVIGGAVGT